jgi:hypothetical protein
MTKAYLSQWKPRKRQVEKQGEEHWSDFMFDHRPEKAAFWPTKQDADNDCQMLNQFNVRIVSPDGGQHLFCKNFTVEELAPDKFVVFCMLPWESKVEK